MFSQRRSHYWSQQSRTFFFKGFSAKQQKKPKKAANYSIIEQNALSDKHPKMTGQTRVWPVKPTIRPDMVRWPAVILSPAIHLIEEHWLLIITGVQASEVIIDCLLRQGCFESNITKTQSIFYLDTISERIPITTAQILLPAFNFNGQSLKLPDEWGPTISDHTKQHCRNKWSMITPEAWTPVIINTYILWVVYLLLHTYMRTYILY